MSEAFEMLPGGLKEGSSSAMLRWPSKGTGFSEKYLTSQKLYHSFLKKVERRAKLLHIKTGKSESKPSLKASPTIAESASNRSSNLQRPQIRNEE